MGRASREDPRRGGEQEETDRRGEAPEQSEAREDLQNPPEPPRGDTPETPREESRRSCPALQRS